MLAEVGALARLYKQRLTSHPSAFVKLAALKEDVVEKSLLDLENHARVRRSYHHCHLHFTFIQRSNNRHARNHNIIMIMIIIIITVKVIVTRSASARCPPHNPIGGPHDALDLVWSLLP